MDKTNKNIAERYEMQFKYLHLGCIQGQDKMNVSRTFKNCSEIELFELEPIQHIIDYKWNTYTK